MADSPRLVNTHDQLQAALQSGLLTQENALAIFPSRGSSSSGEGTQDGWLLYSPFFPTDPNALRYNHGQRWFPLYAVSISLPASATPAVLRNIRKQAALNNVISYCRTHYGLSEFKRNRLGDYVPLAVDLAFPLPKRPPLTSAVKL